MQKEASQERKGSCLISARNLNNYYWKTCSAAITLHRSGVWLTSWTLTIALLQVKTQVAITINTILFILIIVTLVNTAKYAA